MAYVKTSDEVADAQLLVSELTYLSDGLTVQFRTEMDFIREVLPPCFDLPEEPLAFASVMRSLTQVTGYRGASLNVRARYRDLEGWYHLTLLYTGDMPVTLGRELWGEPKKRGEITLTADGRHAHGHAERNGVRLIEISAEIGQEVQEETAESHYTFNIKAFSNGSATALEYDPIVVVAEPFNEFDKVYRATGTLELNSSAYDACGSVPIERVDSVRYWTGRQTRMNKQPQRFVHPNSGDYLPYILGRNYDLIAQYTL